MRIIGLDIHRAFAEAVAWENGKLTRLGRIDMRRDRLTAFAASLPATDVVVVEATGNAAAVADVIGRHVKRVVIANPKQVRIIAHAKIKTDTIDAGVLAQLHASGFLPEVWIADEPTQALRRQVTRRNQIVRQRTRLKNIMQSILHAHLLRHQSHQSSTQDVESSSQGYQYPDSIPAFLHSLRFDCFASSPNRTRTAHQPQRNS
jgi:transposase